MIEKKKGTIDQENDNKSKFQNEQQSEHSELSIHQIQDLEALRDRVDSLEVKAAEKRKPWYLSFGGVSGLLAIVLSIFSVIYTLKKDKSSDIESQKKEITGNLINLQQLEMDALVKAKKDSINVDDYVTSDYYLQQRFEIFLNNIDGINRQIPNKLYSQSYIYIGFCYLHYSFKNDKAMEYYKYALKAAKDVYDSDNVYNSISYLYFTQGLDFDTVKATQYFYKDINLLKRLKGIRRDYYMAYAYASTAADNESNINLSISKKYIDTAKILCNNLKNNPGIYEYMKYKVNIKINYINNKFKESIQPL